MELFGLNALTLIIILLFIFLIASVAIDLIHDIKSKKESEQAQID